MMSVFGGNPIVDPHAAARVIERQHAPWWRCWFGEYTGIFWAAHAWYPRADDWISAPTPSTLNAKIAHFETWHPHRNNGRSAVTETYYQQILISEPRPTNRRDIRDMTRIETETLTRFAAEFLYRVKWAPATAHGLERAYLETIHQPLAALLNDDVYADIQDLAERVYGTYSEDFGMWAIREIPRIRKILRIHT